MKNTPAFWDASALVPLCVNQATSHQAHFQYRKFALAVWWGTFVEVQSALCRLRRQGQIPDAAKKGGSERLRLLSRAWREVIPDDSVRAFAVEVLDKHSLTAADSLQLAAALVWCAERPARRTFICADQRLARAANSVGFSVIQF